MNFQTKQNRVYQVHTFTKVKTKEEENKIPRRRISMQEGMLRKKIGISVRKTTILKQQ